MFRTLRAVILAIVIASSFVASGSVASADPGKLPKLPPVPARFLDVTCE